MRSRFQSLLVLFLFLSSFSYGEMRTLSLRGHLDNESVQRAQTRLETFSLGEGDSLILELNSSSGDMLSVLEFAKRLYELKIRKKVRLLIYIDDSALGPAAVLPFLADELTSSVFVSWGDVVLNGSSGLPTNVLRSRVKSLVTEDHPRAWLLQLMAEGMVDASLKIVDDRGWRLSLEGDPSDLRVISPSGETLVVNHNQLRQQQLVTASISLDDFRKSVGLSQEEQREVDEASQPPLLRGEEQKLIQSLKEKIAYHPNGPNTVGRIVIDDRTSGINRSTWIYVKAALDHFKETKPAFILLELNTPGGEVYSAQKISDALKEMDTIYQTPVVALINNWAISAGAMLAYSCRYIAVVKDASMGAAEPVFQGEGGKMQSAPEKVNSALRADFANRARFYDRNPDLAEAMVDKDAILVLRYGRIVKLDSEDQVRRTGSQPDVIVSAKGKLLTLNSQQMIDYGVADLFLEPQAVPPKTEEEQSTGRWPAKKSLLFTYPFFEQIPGAVVESYQMDWRMNFFAILVHPVVSSILFLGMMLGFYMELSSPGFGLPGAVGLTCLFLVILSSFAIDAASLLELIMVMTGLVLLAVELFVIPGFGVAGFLGIVLTVFGLFALMLPELGSIALDSDQLTAAGQEFLNRLGWLCASLVVGLILIAFMARYMMPSMTALRHLVSEGEENAADGYTAGARAEDLPSLGAEGVVAATLRPAGKVWIEGEMYDAVSDGQFIEEGKDICVVQIQGSRVVVREQSSKGEG